MKCYSCELLSWSDIYRLSTIITIHFFVTALCLPDLRLVHNTVCKVFPGLVPVDRFVGRNSLFIHGINSHNVNRNSKRPRQLSRDRNLDRNLELMI